MTNAKKAKRLRREAESLTTGFPARGYARDKRTGAAIVHPKTTRSVYRSLKRGKA